MKAVQFGFLTIAIVAIVISQGGFADALEKTIQIPEKHHYSIMQGSVFRGERDTYSFKAAAGQRIKVTITSKENNAVFAIFTPVHDDTLKGASEMDDAMSWEGPLPDAGVYRIVVGGTRGNTSYTLKLSQTETAAKN